METGAGKVNVSLHMFGGAACLVHSRICMRRNLSASKDNLFRPTLHLMRVICFFLCLICVIVFMCVCDTAWAEWWAMCIDSFISERVGFPIAF